MSKSKKLAKRVPAKPSAYSSKKRVERLKAAQAAFDAATTSPHFDWQLVALKACASIDADEMRRLGTHRHSHAFHTPRAGHESAIVALLNFLGEYAAAHARTWDAPLAADGYCGDYWKTIARSAIALLSGETGRLDGGTCDRMIRDFALKAGFDADLGG